MSIVRIAPICNGKIYVVPRPKNAIEPGRLDLPMESPVPFFDSRSCKYAKLLIERFPQQLSKQTEPRYSVRHTSECFPQKNVVLYILPLKQEDDIHFEGGKFVTPEDIQMGKALFSTCFLEERETLEMAAQLWEMYQ